MKAVSVRNLPPAVSRAIRERASRDRMSASRAVIALLEEATGRKRPHSAARVHTDLDHLAGVWSREEAARFERCLAAQRTIDPDIWK
jgi:plasmid stability protein